jgi:hypothetical protein
MYPNPKSNQTLRQIKTERLVQTGLKTGLPFKHQDKHMSSAMNEKAGGCSVKEVRQTKYETNNAVYAIRIMTFITLKGSL